MHLSAEPSPRNGGGGAEGSGSRNGSRIGNGSAVERNIDLVVDNRNQRSLLSKQTVAIISSHYPSNAKAIVIRGPHCHNKYRAGRDELDVSITYRHLHTDDSPMAMAPREYVERETPETMMQAFNWQICSERELCLLLCGGFQDHVNIVIHTCSVSACYCRVLGGLAPPQANEYLHGSAGPSENEKGKEKEKEKEQEQEPEQDPPAIDILNPSASIVAMESLPIRHPDADVLNRAMQLLSEHPDANGDADGDEPRASKREKEEQLAVLKQQLQASLPIAQYVGDDAAKKTLDYCVAHGYSRNYSLLLYLVDQMKLTGHLFTQILDSDTNHRCRNPACQTPNARLTHCCKHCMAWRYCSKPCAESCRFAHKLVCSALTPQFMWGPVFLG